MFICPDCGKPLQLPSCACGYIVKRKNGVYQFTDTSADCPDEDINYIGYEHIGGYFEGKNWIENSKTALKIGEVIAEYTKNGIFLDTACGNGYITVPALIAGCRVVCVDDSNYMLSLLLKKAAYHNVPFNRLTACHMNTLSMLLADGSFNCASASFLQFVNDPVIGVNEIYRLLRAGGTLILIDSSPVMEVLEPSNYYEILDYIYGKYWKILEKKGILHKKITRNPGPEEALYKKFGNKREIVAEIDDTIVVTLEDCGLYRLKQKSYSEQINVPEFEHIDAYNTAYEETAKKYGDDFIKASLKIKTKEIKLIFYVK